MNQTIALLEKEFLESIEMAEINNNMALVVKQLFKAKEH